MRSADKVPRASKRVSQLSFYMSVPDYHTMAMQILRYIATYAMIQVSGPNRVITSRVHSFIQARRDVAITSSSISILCFAFSQSLSRHEGPVDS
ncbi:hypothetical protein VTL71DRAFT_8515, partial [Oculimacula yallundae]